MLSRKRDSESREDVTIGILAPWVNVRTLPRRELLAKKKYEPREASLRQSSRPELHYLSENSTEKIDYRVVLRITRRVLILVLEIPI